MDILAKPSFTPRKLPVQARSTASVEAILEATIQVLLLAGKQRLTTNRVAARAGVSIGTLYQYFPNKNALLHAALRRHLDQVYKAVTDACARHTGQSLRAMGEGLVAAFLQAKFERIETSLALYQIRDDVQGAAVAESLRQQAADAITAMLRSSHEPLATDLDAVTSMLFTVMAETSRRMLESKDPPTARLSLQPQLTIMVTAYLEALKA